MKEDSKGIRFMKLVVICVVIGCIYASIVNVLTGVLTILEAFSPLVLFGIGAGIMYKNREEPGSIKKKSLFGLLFWIAGTVILLLVPFIP